MDMHLLVLIEVRMLLQDLSMFPYTRDGTPTPRTVTSLSVGDGKELVSVVRNPCSFVHRPGQNPYLVQKNVP